MLRRQRRARSFKSAVSEIFNQSKGVAQNLLRRPQRAAEAHGTVRRRRQVNSVETLEVRALLSTITVTSTADSGVGTLRRALLDASASGAADTIEFGISGGGTQTITLTTALPDLSANDTVDLNAYDISLVNQVITGAGTITNNAASGTAALTLDGTGTFSGIIQDGGAANTALTVEGGTVTLTGASTYTGATTVNGGNLTVNGTIPSSVSVNGTGTLSGNATVNGNLLNQATVSPGNSPGIITVNGNYNQPSAGALTIEIQGTNAATPEFDQLIVTGSVTLAGNLNVSLLSGYYPIVNDSFMIIDNDAADPITGTFFGLPDDTLIALGGATFRIDYDGGTGNDVVLTVTNSPYLLVSNTNDSGAGSLREAVSDANSLAGVNTIVFSSLFNTVHTMTLTSGELALIDSDTTTITGPGANLLSISGNSAGRVFLINAGASADLSGLTVTGGSGVFIGGGVRNDGTLIMTSVTMSGNIGDHGGGFGNTGLATVNNCTFSGNSSPFEGGGLENYGTLSLKNSTIAGNSALRGGGIANAGGGWISLTNCTVSGNSAGTSGGGVDNILGTVTLTNTIIAGQTLGGDIDGVVSGSNNLIGTGGSGGLVDGVSGNIVGIADPGLSALASNGGSTKTMALLAASPAINAGDSDAAPPNDQRGQTRFGSTDIGAFEYQFKVTTTSNGGNGSLRQAILNANATPGTDTVVFRIGAGPRTIAPTSAFPIITQTIVIDGTTQPGFAGTPLIQINGYTAGNVDGLNLVVGSEGSTIKGLIVSNFGSTGVFGIRLGGANHTVQGNWIGLDSTGTSAAANANGILLGSGNLIGTDGDGVNDTAERNVISGNLSYGVLGNGGNNSRIAGNYIGTNAAGDAPLNNGFSNVYMQFTSGHIIGTDGSNDAFNANERNVIASEVLVGDDTVVAGNYVGLNAAGTAALMTGSFHLGVQFGNATSGARIGTNADGIADAEERNVISGLDGWGIVSTGGPLAIAGNYIGTNPAGTAAIPNQQGIYLTSSATGVRIGTNADGVNDAAESNLISGNTVAGVQFSNTSNTNVVAGNMIGLNAAGTAALGNDTGILIDAGSSNNIIGGTTAAARNTISGNVLGVFLDGAATIDNIIQGNYIGLNAAGTSSIANTLGGVLVGNGAGSNTIGGSVAGAGNVISGNGGIGISVGYSADGIVIQGNLIGTSPDGSAALPNTASGIQLHGINAIVGGTSAAERNVISGNSDAGITVDTSSGNVILGNYIGTNPTGTLAVPNSVGIRLDVNATSNFIGGTAAGARNIISGNTTYGVLITGSGTSDNTVAGNYIGTDATGTLAIANAFGIIINAGATNNLIGGTNSAARNIISGNTDQGIWMDGIATSGNLIRGNYIGTDITGGIDLGNTLEGIAISGAPGNTIGGAVAGAGNVISGNNQHGIVLNIGAHNTVVEGNLIGLNAAGDAIIFNSGDGIHVSVSDNVRIGSTNPLGRNVVSGNASSGVGIRNGSNGTVVLGNFIGTDMSGTVSLGNTSEGVSVTTGSTNSFIGGTTASARNVISGNTGSGVFVDDVASTGNIVQGNYIGTDVTGTLDLGNGLIGVHVRAPGNTIGGVIPGAGNVISGNNGSGILLNLGAHSAIVQGNIVGLTAAGDAFVRNSGDGITVSASNNVQVGSTNPLGRNIFSGNTSAGIQIANGAAGTIVVGNYIGTDISGTISIGNLATGVKIVSGAADNTIGGITADARNIISGNIGDGINVSGSGTDNNLIRGNYIGTDVTGNAGIPNQQAGINLQGGAGTIIGGFTATVGETFGNVISGNIGRGILDSFDASDTIIRGNLIGLGADGVTGLGNGNSGIQVNGLNTLIGGDDDDDGSLDGTVQARNIISGNTTQGINIGHSGSARNTIIRGNYVGTTRDGSAAASNTVGGINVGSAPGTYVGGDTPGAGNLISGNGGSGISINAISHPEIGGLYNVVVQGNTIGLNAAGTASLSTGVGISVSNASNLIGGTTDGARNVISGNASRGIEITSSGATGNVVIGNYIGTNAVGTTSFGNALSGVRISAGASGNTIGASVAGGRNVISGNTGIGIEIDDADSNVVIGNYVGLNAAGTNRIANSLNSIQIANTASGNRIGTDGDGVNDAGERNVISGNASGANVNIADVGTMNNIIAGNYIGTTADGSAGVVNNGRGIRIAQGASFNRVGTDGSNDAFNANERNIVSGHTDLGIFIVASNDNIVAGNYVGLNATGTASIGNASSGIYLNTVTRTQVGTNSDGISDSLEANVVAGSGGFGIAVVSTATLNTVAGNLIGTDATGTFALPNAVAGLAIAASSTLNTIGGTAPGAGNVISGNSGPGIWVLRTYLGVTYPASPDNTILGNLIGTDITGTQDLGNAAEGILIEEPNTTIGGTTLSARNVISGNDGSGILITGAPATGVVATGNYIGTNAAGTSAIANATGIWIGADVVNTTIGGAAAGAGNIIANSLTSGLRLEGTTAVDGTYLNNTFYGNQTMGIDAGVAGVTPNDGGQADGVPDFPVVSGASFSGGNLILTGVVEAGRRVDFFVSAPTSNGIGQGQQLIASLTEGSGVDQNGASGAFLFVIPIPAGVADGTPLTALTIGSTSEFSPVLFAGEVGSHLAPQITLSAASVTLTAGGSITVDGSFYDPDSTDWEATVDYDDGSGIQPLSLNADHSFQLQHIYNTPRNYTVTVQVRDSSLTVSTKTVSVVVQNEAPTATFNLFTITSPASEGQLVTLTGQFEDTSGTHTATIEWGDGQTSIVPITPGAREFTGTHIYLDDSNAAGTATPADVYRVVVTITDEAHAGDITPVGLFLEEIRNVVPSTLNVNFSSTTITEGQAVSLNGSFADPGILDAHTVRINWGDGNESLVALPVGARSFTGLSQLTHVYVDDPSVGADEYSITVEVVDDDQPESPASLSRVVTVANAIPSSVTASVTSSVILENGIATLSGSFVDAGFHDSHTVTVDWGDGTSKTTVNPVAGTTTFTGLTHRYLDDPTVGSSYTITVSVSDSDSPDQSGVYMLPITVENVAPTVGPITVSTGGSPILEGDQLSVSGSYLDVSPADRHTVRVFWGDGTDSLAQLDAMTRTFTADHTYQDNGTSAISGIVSIDHLGREISRWTSQIRVVVTDDDGQSGEATVNQEVNNVSPTVDLQSAATNTNPNQISLLAVTSDPGASDAIGVTWTAIPVGGPSSAAQSGSGASILINRSAFPSSPWKVSVTAVDDDGGSTLFETALLIGTTGDDVGSNRLIVTNATFIQANTRHVMALALNGNDVIDATAVTNSDYRVVMVGGAGVDNLYGGVGDDTYNLAEGNDSANVPITGGPVPVEGGNDRYVLRPNSILTVIDTIGDNILDFSDASFGVTFDLSLNSTTTLTTQDVLPVTGQTPIHEVRTQGTFSELTGSGFDDKLTGATDTTLFGGAGDDSLLAISGTSGLTFRGGADDDILHIIGSGISNLNFGGDAGVDTLINLGSVSNLTFGGDAGVDTLINQGSLSGLTFRGGADDDILQNSGNIGGLLNFGGDAGVDMLLNTWSITSLTFGGGADDDILINNGTATITSLNFGGDDGADALLNYGTVSSLTFRGGADGDILQNTGSVLTSLNFGGDDGIDGLFNTGFIATLTFNGGADDDILINNGPLQTSLNFGGDDQILLAGTGSIGNLNFGGDAGADVLVNLGTMTSLTFRGGADDDILINSGPGVSTLSFGGDDSILLSGAAIVGTLSFGGDAGVDLLLNTGSVSTLTFTGGADGDVLINATGAEITTLHFGGDLDSTDPFADDGADTLLNAGTVTTLTFRGGADDDILQNTGNVLGSLNFGGDDGADTLFNTGTMATLTFTGGADDDILQNTGTVIGSLNFGGDNGVDILVNAGNAGSLVFTGGADGDILQNTGTVIGSLNFGGDDGADTLLNTGTVATLTFGGGADDDILVNRGTVTEVLNFGGDDDILISTGGNVTLLNFGGDGGVDVLVNQGSLGGLIFTGGADDDVLQNSGIILGSLNFGGDGGADLLVNTGSVVSLTFTGGADDDILFNTGTVTSLTFLGGADDDVLINNADNLASLTFNGGADDDVLINNGSVIVSLTFTGGADDDVLISNGSQITTLNFTGDDGIPVTGHTSDDTLIVRGSGTGDAASLILFNGGYGIDAFENNATGFASITFNGGADDDVLLNNASGLAMLTFNGDAGVDVLVNHGANLTTLTFTGGADDDILVNDGPGIISLTFTGGADDDLLINSGHQLGSLTFNGGADDDILVNQGNQIATLTFHGGADDDILINDGAYLGSLVFNGELGNNQLWNRKSGVGIGAVEFTGDAGVDILINHAAANGTLTFTGGADDDILQNSGSVVTLVFTGGADDDVLVNTGSAGTITFRGGADDDILLNRGTEVSTLNFGGDAGADTLFNVGTVANLTYGGGADDDVLLNNGTVIGTLNFGGDDAILILNDSVSLLSFGGDVGADLLINNGTVATLTFQGGADDDILQNNASVVSLTFLGGADDDILLNNGNNIVSLHFGGDNGADTLINNGSAIASLTFTGGADGDTLRIHGRDIGSVGFDGGDGVDSFTYNAAGAATSTVTYDGQSGNDLFAFLGTAGTVSFDGGLGDDAVLIVGSAVMTMTGGDGNDIYRFVSNPLADVTLTDAYSGTGDVFRDTLDFSSFTGGPLNLDLRLVNVWQAQGNGQLRIRLMDGLSVENVIGSPFGDTIYGNPRSNYIGGADFDDAFTGPVAASRGVTQWVLLDFDTYTNTGIVDAESGLADAGEHFYTTTERELIRERIEATYRGPNVGAPWFDVRIVNSLTEIPASVRTASDFATIYFNQTPDSGRPGGLSSEIDPGNVNFGGHALVQINGLLGGIITELDASTELEGDFDSFKGDLTAVSEIEIGATKPSGTSENFVRLSAKIAAHELGHLLGLRHQDSFGPIGSGVHDPPGVGGYKPMYTGPAGGFETFDHIIGSPASIGSTRFDDLNDLFFGEREAIKLAFANSNPAQTTRSESTIAHNSLTTADPLSPVTLAVPNTLSRGLNQPKDFFVQLAAIDGQIHVSDGTGRSESDWYSFTGRAGELINIDVLSNSLARYGTGPGGAMSADDFVDTVVRVWYVIDGTPTLVPYYNGVAENDDTFEPTDSSLIDLVLPIGGTYFIEVDTFHRYGDALGNPSNPSSPLNPSNPKNVLANADLTKRFRDSVNDTDTGRYQLIMYKFRKANSTDGVDDLKGFGGVDIIVGGPGDNYALDFSLGSVATGVIEAGDFSRSVTISDRGASAWIGSRVNYGDNTGDQDLAVSAAGEFSLNHVWADNGSYTVTVTIVDDIGQTLTRQLAVIVDNVNPSATLSGPTSGTTGTLFTMISMAADAAGAADPLSYSWTITRNSAAFDTQNGGTSYSFTPDLAGSYVITLTVSDGDGGVTSASHTLTVTAANTAPTVSISGPVSGVRGQSLTWLFTATDVDAADQAGHFVWTINWGDGSATQTVTGLASVAVSHVYLAESATSYLVTAAATDARGEASSTTSLAVQILQWQIQADPLQPGSQILVVGGSVSDDRIRLTQHGSGADAFYKLRIDTHSDSESCDDEEENNFTVRIYSAINGVIVYGQAGNDRIELQNNLSLWSMLDGGADNDTIKGGGAANIVLGGNGDDHLYGEKGRDLLIGGRGLDKIEGGKDEDLLVAGYTLFDDNRAALQAILREWTSSRSFTARRSNLMGTTADGLNGSYLLRTSGTGPTVFDDNSLDQLWGGEGRDWFLLNMDSDEDSRRDQLKDWRTGDEDDDIDLF